MPETTRAAEPRPGDLIINRYMPNATLVEKEEARQNLRQYARTLLAINERLLRERGAEPALKPTIMRI